MATTSEAERALRWMCAAYRTGGFTDEARGGRSRATSRDGRGEASRLLHVAVVVEVTVLAVFTRVAAPKVLSHRSHLVVLGLVTLEPYLGDEHLVGGRSLAALKDNRGTAGRGVRIGAVRGVRGLWAGLKLERGIVHRSCGHSPNESQCIDPNSISGKIRHTTEVLLTELASEAPEIPTSP